MGMGAATSGATNSMRNASSGGGKGGTSSAATPSYGGKGGGSAAPSTSYQPQTSFGGKGGTGQVSPTVQPYVNNAVNNYNQPSYSQPNPNLMGLGLYGGGKGGSTQNAPMTQDNPYGIQYPVQPQASMGGKGGSLSSPTGYPPSFQSGYQGGMQPSMGYGRRGGFGQPREYSDYERGLPGFASTQQAPSFDASQEAYNNWISQHKPPSYEDWSQGVNARKAKYDSMMANANQYPPQGQQWTGFGQNPAAMTPQEWEAYRSALE